MRGIYFNGRRVLRPQAISKIDDSGMFGRGLGGGNTLAVIGEATGGEPGKVLYFTSPGEAKAILRSGDLLTAVQRAYDPSNFAGAYSVAAVRVNPAAQSTLTLKDTIGVDIITLTSLDYGAWNNLIKVRVEDATSGKKITIQQGSSYDQGDNIVRKSFALGLADPLAVSGTLTINHGTGKLTTAVTATPQEVYLNASPLTAPYALQISASDHGYIGSSIPFKNFIVTISSGNSIDKALVVEYWNGSAWVAVSGLTDGTYNGGTLHQTGTVSFTLPTAWRHSDAATGAPVLDYYWIRLSATGSLTGGISVSSLVLTRAGLDITLSAYPTIQNLVDYLDAQLGYEAVALTSAPTVESSIDLDDCSGVDFIGSTITEYVDIDSTKTIIEVADSSSFSIGDRIVISQINPTSYPSEEIRRIVSLPDGAHIIVDSALALTYSDTPGDPIRRCPVLDSDLQAIVDWINANSTFVTAERLTTGELANIGNTYMSGGSEGTVAQSDWDNALATLQTEDTPLIVVVSYDQAVWASLQSHVDFMSTVGKKERRGFVGGFTTDDGYTGGLGKWNGTSNIQASIDQMLVYAKEINTDRVYYVGPGIIAFDENGNRMTYPGSIAAALVAGLAAGVDVAEPLTHKNIKVLGLEYNFSWSDLDRLLDGGVLPLEFDPSVGYRICQSISTWLVNDNYYRRELSVGRVGDYVARNVRDRLEQDFVGKKGTATTLLSIKNATISVLNQMYRLDLLAGNADNPPYKNIQVRLDGDTVYVEFECSPVIPINYIPITIHLTVFTATLVA